MSGCSTPMTSAPRTVDRRWSCQHMGDIDHLDPRRSCHSSLLPVSRRYGIAAWLPTACRNENQASITPIDMTVEHIDAWPPGELPPGAQHIIGIDGTCHVPPPADLDPNVAAPSCVYCETLGAPAADEARHGTAAAMKVVVVRRSGFVAGDRCGCSKP